MTDSKKIPLIFNVIAVFPAVIIVVLPFLFFSFKPAFFTVLAALILYVFIQSDGGLEEDEGLLDLSYWPTYLKSTLIFLLISLGLPISVTFLLSWLGWV